MSSESRGRGGETAQPKQRVLGDGVINQVHRHVGTIHGSD
jgi:hypothetical protein